MCTYTTGSCCYVDLLFNCFVCIKALMYANFTSNEHTESNVPLLLLFGIQTQLIGVAKSC